MVAARDERRLLAFAFWKMLGPEATPASGDTASATFFRATPTQPRPCAIAQF